MARATVSPSLPTFISRQRETRSGSPSRDRCTFRPLSYPPRSCGTLVVRRGRPLLHRLRTGAIDVDLVVDGLHPAHRDVMVLSVRILVELDGVGPFHVVDHSKLSVVRADDRGIGLNLVGVDHARRRSKSRAARALAARWRAALGLRARGA